MNPIFKFFLKVLSKPKINIKKHYESMRVVRKMFSGAPKAGYRILEATIFSEDYSHEIPVRVFHPKIQDHPEPILFFHGGGWVIGDIETYTNPCINLADAMGRVVYSVDYRLAPEHPYPAGFEDCYRVASLLFENFQITGAEAGTRWILMGDSAGANLAAAVSLKLRDEGKQAAAQQVLVYPVTYWDHTEDSPYESIHTKGSDYGMTSKRVQSYMELYAPDLEVRKSPYVSPIMAEDLSQLPDTLVVTAEYDPLRDEGEAFGKAIRKDGTPARVHEVKNAVHGFFTYPKNAETLNDAYEAIKRFLNEKNRKERIG